MKDRDVLKSALYALAAAGSMATCVLWIDELKRRLRVSAMMPTMATRH